MGLLGKLRPPILFVQLVIALHFSLQLPAAAQESAKQPAIAVGIEHGGFAVEKNGKVIVAHQPDGLFVPASIWKIVTGLAALKYLGPGYRFTTNFFLDGENNLFIQGQGDPGLVSEEVGRIMAALKARGAAAIKNIYIDNHLYRVEAVDGAGTSDNPYDARCGGVAVNFNTIRIVKTKMGVVSSGEPQTPTLPMMADLAAGLRPGDHRLNISADRRNTVRYAAELFRAVQQQLGIAGEGSYAEREAAPGLAPIYSHQSSRTLEEILSGLMLYSNNFTANQLLLACGGAEYGYPADLEKGRRALDRYLHEVIGLGPEEVQVQEGSGLSRANRVTPAAMLKILAAFKPYARLLPEMRGQLVKSGTLTGVYSYAGYLRDDSGRLDSFVLILNQKRNSRDQLLDKIIHLHRMANPAP